LTGLSLASRQLLHYIKESEIDKKNSRREHDSLCDWFWCDAKPGIISQAHAFIIPRKDGISLGKVSEQGQPEVRRVEVIDYKLLYVPGHLVLSFIVAALIGEREFAGWTDCEDLARCIIMGCCTPHDV